GPEIQALEIYSADKFFEENPYNEGSKALPFTTISIVEQYYLVKNANPASMDDFIQVNGFTPLNFSVPFSLHEKTLATTTTDAQGNFSFTVNQQHPCGVVIAAENAYSTLHLGNNRLDNYYTAQVHGKYLIRVLRIMVEDGRYFSPDIIMMPKPGSSLSTGTQTALIQPYRMKVNLIPVGQGGVIFDDVAVPMLARVVRKHSDLSALQPGHPVFEPTSIDNTNNVDLNPFNMYGQGKVYYSSSIDESPELWIRNMVAHKHGPAHLYYLLLETDDNKPY